MVVTFNEFIQKHELEKKATLNITIQSICKDVDIYLRNVPFISDSGKVYLHPTEGTH